MRKSGHSFRQICKALATASDGTKVIYLCENPRSRDYYHRMAESMVQCLADVEIRRDKIILPNHVPVEFQVMPTMGKRSELEQMRGAGHIELFYDD